MRKIALVPMSQPVKEIDSSLFRNSPFEYAETSPATQFVFNSGAAVVSATPQRAPFLGQVKD
jgi:hypothetical protein